MSVPYSQDGGPGGGGYGGGGKPPGGGSKSKGTVGSQPSLITSTGGLYGYNNALLIPYQDANGRTYLVIYDPANYNTEEDCVYEFKLEDISPGRAIDIHQVYFQYRDLGLVNFTVTVRGTLYDRATKKETLVSKTVIVKWGTTNADRKIHSYYVDLKTVCERPQLRVVRKADQGPLAIIRAMMFGNSDEDADL